MKGQIYISIVLAYDFLYETFNLRVPHTITRELLHSLLQLL